jgi:hypothetical protein
MAISHALSFHSKHEVSSNGVFGDRCSDKKVLDANCYIGKATIIKITRRDFVKPRRRHRKLSYTANEDQSKVRSTGKYVFNLRTSYKFILSDVLLLNNKDDYMSDEPPPERSSYPLFFGLGAAFLLGAGFWVAVIGLSLFLFY